MTCLRLSKDVSKRSKIETKGKKGKERITHLNDKDVFGVSLFTGDKSKTDEGGSWEKKAQKAGDTDPPAPLSNLLQHEDNKLRQCKLAQKKNNKLGYTRQVSMTDVFSLLVDSSCFTSLGVQVHLLQKFAYLQF